MEETAYKNLAKVLDTLPNGFPSTETGLEIKLLKKVFTPDEAELFCDLKLHLETAGQIAERTGRPVEGLDDKLHTMWQKGEIWREEVAGEKSFRMIPWIVGIYEFQLNRMDREFCELCEEYSMYFGPQLVTFGPSIMQVIPIEEDIPAGQKALPYQQVSSIIENGKSFMVNECICKKEQGIMDNPCRKPTEVCLAIGSEEGAFDNHFWGGKIVTRDGALEVLKKAEEAGLVHLSTNVQSGHWYICNCCGCCCGVLGAVKMGIPNVVNSHYYARIDPDLCEACGTCLDERCQVEAIEEGEETYRVNQARCIGCGLCIATCPTEAIQLVRKPDEEIVHPPQDEIAWLDERARQRGVDYSAFK